MRELSRRPFAVSLLLSTLACTAKTPPDQQAAADKAPETAPAADPAAVTEPAPEPALPSLPSEPPAVEPLPESEPTPVLVDTPIVAAPHSPPWTAGGSVPESLRFEPVTMGVLASAAGRWYSLDDAGAIVVDDSIEAPDGPVIGAWPKDAWTISVEEPRADYVIQLYRWRGNGKWVPQDIDGSQKLGTDHLPLMTKGWRGGFLIDVTNAESESSFLRRVAGGADDPLLPRVPGIVALFETSGGRMYLLAHEYSASKATDWLVQKSCEDEDDKQACEQATRRILPCPEGSFGCKWELSPSAPRQRFSVSIAARRYFRPSHDADQQSDCYLLGYEEGGWKLEHAPDGACFARLLPSKDGGLWLTDEGTGVWHRDPKGVWRSIELPAGYASGGAVQLAIAPDQKTVYLVGAVGGQWQSFTTHADAQNPPPASADAVAPSE